MQLILTHAVGIVFLEFFTTTFRAENGSCAFSEAPLYIKYTSGGGVGASRHSSTSCTPPLEEAASSFHCAYMMESVLTYTSLEETVFRDLVQCQVHLLGGDRLLSSPRSSHL
eukprot:497509-Amphidinium_carterae.1